MSGDHNQYQKNLSYLDFECPRCGHCCQAFDTEQEPVAWMYVNEDGECEQIEYGPVFDDPGVTPLYTTPPKAAEWFDCTDTQLIDEVRRRGFVIRDAQIDPVKREWVGLTDDDVSYFRYQATFCDEFDAAFMAELIEKDLKEKNHG